MLAWFEVSRFQSRAAALAAPFEGFGQTGESLKIAVHTVHLSRDIKSREHDEPRPCAFMALASQHVLIGSWEELANCVSDVALMHQII